MAISPSWSTVTKATHGLAAISANGILAVGSIPICRTIANVKSHYSTILTGWYDWRWLYKETASILCLSSILQLSCIYEYVYLWFQKDVHKNLLFNHRIAN